jgi:hypothetical protein
MSDAPKKKRRFRIGCLGICVCAFFAFVLMCIGIKLYMMHALESELDALRAAGEPVTREEVLASIEPVPDEENSALVLQPHLDAISGWVETPTGEVLYSGRQQELGVRPSDEMLDVMRKCMVSHAAILDTLHDASKRPHGRWPQPAKPPDEAPGFLLAVRRGSWLLDAEGWLHAATGDVEGTARTLKAAVRLPRSLNDDPNYNSAHTMGSCEQKALSTLEGALSLISLSARDISSLRAELTTGALPLDLSPCTRAERANLLWHVTDPSGRRGLLEEFDEGGAGQAVSFLPGIVEADALCLLRFMNEWSAIYNMPYREQLVAARQFTADMVANPLGEYDPRWASRLVLKNVGSAYGLISVSLVKAAQRRTVAGAALAVEQFRIERGRWPNKLDALVPDYLDAVPQDWFAPAGTTIRYRHTPTGVSIWSRSEKGMGGVTGESRDALYALSRDVYSFKRDNGRLPKTLDELVPDIRESIPIDPRTGKTWTYRTNPANPELFILGGFTDGMAEEDFWNQSRTTQDWAYTSPPREHRQIFFRLLDPKLRGATQGRLCDELGSISRDTALGLHKLGYTPERLKELGFDDYIIEDFKFDVEEFGEKRAHDDVSEQEQP